MNTFLFACCTEKSVGVMNGHELKNKNSVLGVILRIQCTSHKSKCQNTNVQSKLCRLKMLRTYFQKELILRYSLNWFDKVGRDGIG